MKTLIVIPAMAAAVALAGEPADEAAQVAAEEKAFYEAEGGIVEAPFQGRRLNVVNAQTVLGEAKVRELANAITAEMQTGVRVTSDRKAEWPKITLVEDASPRLVIAPEDVNATINVRALAQDGADKKVVGERLLKELWRAYAYLFGAAECEFGPSVTDLVVSLKELDRLACRAPHPATQNSIFKNTARLGVGAVRAVTYRQACREGWAAAPKDDVQRRIRDEVLKSLKEGPKAGLQIKYDAKSGKGVVR